MHVFATIFLLLLSLSASAAELKIKVAASQFRRRSGARVSLVRSGDSKRPRSLRHETLRRRYNQHSASCWRFLANQSSLPDSPSKPSRFHSSRNSQLTSSRASCRNRGRYRNPYARTRRGCRFRC